MLAYVDHSSTIFWHSVVGQVTTLPQFNGMNLTKWSSNGTFVATSPNRIAIVIVNAIHFRHYVGVFHVLLIFVSPSTLISVRFLFLLSLQTISPILLAPVWITSSTESLNSP